MAETFYVHLDFVDKNGKTSWAINLPFLCVRCGRCCTLENFLTAGKIDDPENTYPDVHAKFKALTEELGELFNQDEAKYDRHIADNPCPFLKDNTCSIYPIRSEGCRLYPHTRFGMQATDCEALTRFKKQKSVLKKGKRCKETYHHTVPTQGQTAAEAIKLAKFTEKQYKYCVAKLRQVGITNGELSLFNSLNKRN